MTTAPPAASPTSLRRALWHNGNEIPVDIVFDGDETRNQNVVEQDGEYLIVDCSHFSGRLRLRTPTPEETQIHGPPSVRDLRIVAGHRPQKNESQTDTDMLPLERVPSNSSLAGGNNDSSEVEEDDYNDQDQNQHLYEQHEYETPLHELCGSSDFSMLSVVGLKENCGSESMFEEWIETPDKEGRLPIHILSNNEGLLIRPDGIAIATEGVLFLLEAHPDSVLEEDKNGRIPFMERIQEWVTTINGAMSQKKKNLISGVKGLTTGVMAQTEGMLAKGQQAFNISNSSQDSADGTVPTGIPGKKLDSLTLSGISLPGSSKKSLRFAPSDISPDVEWCFAMLSLGMDMLGGKAIGKKSLDALRPRLKAKSEQVNTRREAMARRIASIPLLLQTVLLLEAPLTRETILNSSIMNRVIFCPESVGPWTTSMLRHRASASAGVDYLRLVSKASLQDYIGAYRTPSPIDIEYFEEAKMNLYRVLDDLGSIIPSLVILPEELNMEAVSLPLVLFMMNRNLASPFIVGMSITDGGLYVTLLLAVRTSILKGFEDASLGDNPAPEPSELEVVAIRAIILLICSHYLVRKIVETIALLHISPSVMKRALLDTWNLLDFLGVVFTTWVVSESSDEVDNRSVLNALIVGLLWIRVVNFLKVVNQNFATFIIALEKIMFNIRHFLIVLVVILFMFADMMHLIFLKHPDIDCDDPDASDPAVDFCQFSSRDSYMRMYALLLGDFEFNDYRQAPSVAIVWLLFTLLGVIIMMNVLIAVVCDSYSTSQGESARLFRKARAEFVSGRVALEKFVKNVRLSKPKDNSDGSKMKRGISAVWGCLNGILRQVARVAIVCSFIFTTLWSVLFVIGPIWNYEAGESILLLIGVICMCFCLVLGMAIMSLVTLESLLKHVFDETNCLYRYLHCVLSGIVGLCASFLFGIRINETSDGSNVANMQLDDDMVDDSNALLTRLDRIELAMQEAKERTITTLTNQKDRVINQFSPSPRGSPRRTPSQGPLPPPNASVYFDPSIGTSTDFGSSGPRGGGRQSETFDASESVQPIHLSL